MTNRDSWDPWWLHSGPSYDEVIYMIKDSTREYKDSLVLNENQISAIVSYICDAHYTQSGFGNWERFMKTVEPCIIRSVKNECLIQNKQIMDKEAPIEPDLILLE